MKMIADQMGLSISTVNRALTGKGRINEETRLKVLKSAHEMGYHPNIQAKSLSSKTVLKIAVICPDDLYFKALIEGVNAYKKECEGYRLELLFPAGGSNTIAEQQAALRTCFDSNVSGILLSSLHPTLLNDDVERFAKAGLPTITVNNDMSGSSRIAYVGPNGSVAGAVAGELMVNFLPPNAKVAHMATRGVAMGLEDRTLAFRATLRANNKNIELCGPFLYYDSLHEENSAVDVAVNVLATQQVQGIYANNMLGTCAIARAIERMGLKDSVVAIGHDLNDDIDAFIRNGTLNITLFQDPFQQGYQSLKLMFEYLYLKKHIRKTLSYIRTSVLMKSNLDEDRNIVFY